MPDAKVIVRNNGPLRLEGEDIVITDQDGNVYNLAGRTVVSPVSYTHLTLPTILLV